MCPTHKTRERHEKCLFFSFFFFFKNLLFFFFYFFFFIGFSSSSSISPPPPFSFFFVDNDTLNGTPFTKQKKRERKKKEKMRGKEKKMNERNAIFIDVQQKDFDDIKRWRRRRRRRRRSCRRISTRAIHLPGCFHRPQRTSRFEARQNIIGFVVLATRTRRTRTQQKKLCDGKRSCPGRRP